MPIFDSRSSRKEKLYAQKRLKQAQNAHFSDGSADSVSFVNKTERELRAEMRNEAWTKTRKVLSIVLLAVGIIALVITLYLLVLRYVEYRSCIADVEGTVVDLYDPGHFDVHSFMTRDTIQYPIIEYYVEGTKFIHNGGAVAGNAPYKTGIRVNVKYKPSDPKIAFFTTEFDSYVINSLINVGICIVLFVAASFLRPKYGDNNYEDEADQ